MFSGAMAVTVLMRRPPTGRIKIAPITLNNR